MLETDFESLRSILDVFERFLLIINGFSRCGRFWLFKTDSRRSWTIFVENGRLIIDFRRFSTVLAVFKVYLSILQDFGMNNHGTIETVTFTYSGTIFYLVPSTISSNLHLTKLIRSIFPMTLVLWCIMANGRSVGMVSRRSRNAVTLNVRWANEEVSAI